MNAPLVRYARAKDGVNIAFYTLGSGPPLLFLNLDLGQVTAGWEYPAVPRFFEPFTERWTLVCMQGRGTGLSDRNIKDYSLEARMSDLEAVLERVGYERFPVFASFHNVSIALKFALDHPDRVESLFLWCGYAKGDEWITTSRMQAIAAMRDKDFDLYLEVLAQNFLRFSTAEEVRQTVGLFHKSVSQADMVAWLAEVCTVDLTPDLERITQPTVVAHARGNPVLEDRLAIELAAAIPNSRLLFLDGDVALPSFNDNTPLIEAIIEHFTGETPGPSRRRPAAPASSAFRTILFTDIEGHTRMMQRLGDVRGRAVLREHERITREQLANHGGTEIKTMGDGFLASFSSAHAALQCAVDLQRAFEARRQEAGEAWDLHIRIGLNAGEPISEEDDLFGSSVIIASRIAAEADGGQILVANVVRELAAGKGFQFTERGDVALRGLEEPVRVYEVAWREGV